MTDNPLLEVSDRPAFGHIGPEHIEPALDAAIAAHERAIAAIEAEPMPDFGNVVMARERADIALGRIWSPVTHLHAVMDSPELRAAYLAAQPKLLAYNARQGQNRRFFDQLEQVAASGKPLSTTEQRALDLAIRGFRLAGVALDEPARGRFADLRIARGQASTAFNNAVLDATNAWSRPLTEAELDGLPEHDRAMFAATARAAGRKGWLATLHGPSVGAIMTYAHDRKLRREVSIASGTRASDQGPDAGRFDNGPRIAQILAMRAEAATLLGFPDPVAQSVSTKMAGDASQILDFLRDLSARVRPAAEAEYARLKQFAATQLKIDTLETWDIGYASNKLQQTEYAIDHSEVRQFLRTDRVMAGMFALLRTLYDIDFVPVDDVDTWHPDVRYYALSRDGGAPFAGLYMDLFARPGKRGGAWMNVCRSKLVEEDRVQYPIAYLNCNFAPPAGDGKPASMTHGEMVILLHEMGHCLHHLLSEIDLPSIAGTSVEWDAVELPSQLMENFGWDPNVLKSMSGHVETGEPMPDDMIGRLIAARRFQAGLGLMRQIEIALFDIELHLHAADADAGTAMRVLKRVRTEVSVIPSNPWGRFPHSFTHVFAGAYASGYYSYLWAERLAADAFERFAEGEPAVIGAAFREEILAVGASRPAIESFVAFRGRQPKSDALLRHYGLAA